MAKCENCGVFTPDQYGECLKCGADLPRKVAVSEPPAVSTPAEAIPEQPPRRPSR